jgi:hypothetical protein
MTQKPKLVSGLPPVLRSASSRVSCTRRGSLQAEGVISLGVRLLRDAVVRQQGPFLHRLLNAIGNRFGVGKCTWMDNPGFAIANDRLGRKRLTSCDAACTHGDCGSAFTAKIFPDVPIWCFPVSAAHSWKFLTSVASSLK